jgi:hypothetical protein
MPTDRPDLTQHRLDQLDNFVERMTPILNDMRVSLAELVRQGSATERMHADFEQRIRILEAQAAAAQTVAGYSRPIVTNVLTALAVGALTFYLTRTS